MVFVIVRLPRVKARSHLGHALVLYVAAFLAVSLLHVKFIEPENEIDRLMHIHEGRLPDLQILEEQEPVDAILLWGKKAAKDHHPIVREPIYFDILEKTCAEIKGVECKRMRAWEYIDMGSITVHGQSYKIDFFNPAVDPKARKLCESNTEGDNPCMKRAATMVCRRIIPSLTNCVEDLTKHIAGQLEEFDSKRLDSKNTYVRLGLEMDAPHHELYPAAASMVRSRGMNISPFARIDNGTASYPKWDRHTSEAYLVMDTYNKVRDPESREWNDKPCTPMFGGSLCAKNDKDGNMIIEM